MGCITEQRCRGTPIVMLCGCGELCPLGQSSRGVKPTTHLRTVSRLRMSRAISPFYSAQNILPFTLLSKNVKIKIYRTTTLSVVLYGCESWSLTLRKECRLRVFENRVLRRIFEPKLMR
jgi:hypothetical protein